MEFAIKVRRPRKEGVVEVGSCLGARLGVVLVFGLGWGFLVLMVIMVGGLGGLVKGAVHNVDTKR